MTGPLEGHVAVVTGGAGGIGLASARALAEAGASLALVDLDEAGLAAAAASLDCEPSGSSPGVLTLALDVCREEDMAAMAEETLARFGRIDVLVTAAGVLRVAAPKPLVQLTCAEWDAVLGVNLRGVFLSNRAVLPSMMAQRRGHIVNLASTSGREGLALDSAYSASKAGVIGLSEAVAQEVVRYGIRVNTVLPGPVDTGLWDQNSPIPRPAEMLPPERVADLILYLVTLPDDTLLVEPVIVPFPARGTRA